MRVNKFGTEYFIRILMIVVSIAGTIAERKDLNYTFYVACLLLFILNSQLRAAVWEGKPALLSLFADFGIIFYLNTGFGGLSYILIFVTVMDSLVLFREEGYAASFAALGLLMYMVRGKSTEICLLLTAVSLMLFLLTRQMVKLRIKLLETERFSDENRKYSYQLEDVRKRLEEYSKKVEHASQLEERNRISGEIHDTIGHRMTGLYMQVEATLRVMETNPEKGTEMLKSVRDNISASIDMLRQTVRNLRPKEYGGRVLSMEKMVMDFARNAGISIDFSVSGNPVKLFPSTETTLYWNAQEALTNAARHGKAKKIKVELDYYEKEVILTVSDDGAGCSNIVKGMGLSGMEERASLLGGKLEIDSMEGFRVKTVIPVRTYEIDISDI